MLLAELLNGVQVTKLFSSFYGRMALTQDIPINSVQYDSRKVGQADLFVAIPGTVTDGHHYLMDVIAQGASAVIVQDDNSMSDSYFMHNSVFKIVVSDSRKALAQLAANYYHHPSRALSLVGVTGTNGKTTTTHMIRSILEADGRKTGLIGTIGNFIGTRKIPSTHTTPESLELNALLHAMVAEQSMAAVMEVSSHSLALSRVRGLRFRAAAFTNLTQDHLDFHGTMENYLGAKKLLFEALDPDACAITNLDDEHGRAVVSTTRGRVLTYSARLQADVTADRVHMDVGGIHMNVATPSGSIEVTSPMTGRFNVENILAAVATGAGLGIAPETIAKGIASMRFVPGRFEQIPSAEGWTAVIDYAHTPDALEQCLKTVRELLNNRKGRIITVFGCGGDRDTTKRPIMGRIASQLSDITIVTSDNPRTEDPERIIDEVLSGVLPGRTVERVVDRRAAIAASIAMAKPGDILLLAGKGHEDYQVIGHEKHHFDDKEELLKNMTPAGV